MILKNKTCRMFAGCMLSITLLGADPSIAQGDIVFVSGTRTVFVSVISPSSNSSPAPGVFNQTVSSSANFGFATVSGAAIQDSMTPSLIGPSMLGSGDVASLVALNAALGTVGVSLISSFDVQFQVDQDGEYDIEAAVAWNGTALSNGGPGFNFTSFEFFDVSSSQTLYSASRDVSQPGTSGLADTLNLETGHIYRVVLRARIGGGHSTVGSHSAQSTWSFELGKVSAIPEPSHALVLMTFSGLWVLSGRRQGINRGLARTRIWKQRLRRLVCSAS